MISYTVALRATNAIPTKVIIIIIASPEATIVVIRMQTQAHAQIIRRIPRDLVTRSLCLRSFETYLNSLMNSRSSSMLEVTIVLAVVTAISPLKMSALFNNGVRLTTPLEKMKTLAKVYINYYGE